MANFFSPIHFIKWFRAAAYKEPPKDTGNALIFRVTRPARYLFRFSIVVAGLFALLAFYVGGTDWYIRAFSILAFLVLLARWPWAVVLDRRGVSKRIYVGIHKTIPWPEVTSLGYERNSHRFTVTGKRGQSIRTSAYVVSPATFHHEMYKRAAGLGPAPTRSALH
jgi:hypothetical protein